MLWSNHWTSMPRKMLHYLIPQIYHPIIDTLIITHKYIASMQI